MARTKAESKLGFFTEVFKDQEIGKLFIQWLFGDYRQDVVGSISVNPDEIKSIITIKINASIDTILIKNDKDCFVFAFCESKPLEKPSGGVTSFMNTKISLYVDESGYVFSPWIL